MPSDNVLSATGTVRLMPLLEVNLMLATPPDALLKSNVPLILKLPSHGLIVTEEGRIANC
jgi:hypothetical protein